MASKAQQEKIESLAQKGYRVLVEETCTGIIHMGRANRRMAVDPLGHTYAWRA